MNSEQSLPEKGNLEAQTEAYYDSLTDAERSEDAAWGEFAGCELASMVSEAKRSERGSGVHYEH